MKACPECGGPLETFLRIDLDDIELAPVPGDDYGKWPTWEVTRFAPAGSANDPATGIVVEEARIVCADCGTEVVGNVPFAVMSHWTFSP